MTTAEPPKRSVRTGRRFKSRAGCSARGVAAREAGWDQPVRPQFCKEIERRIIGRLIGGEPEPAAFRRVGDPFDRAADTVAGYIQGLLDGITFERNAYSLDRNSREAALARLFDEAKDDQRSINQQLAA